MPTMKHANEVFGRHIAFDDIKDIKHIRQPGILHPKYFFNPNAVAAGLNDLNYLRHLAQKPCPIFVYFNNVSAGFGRKSTKRPKSKWWEGLEDFNDALKDFPAGKQLEYFYGDGTGHAVRIGTLGKKTKPYQGFIHLFDDAIQGFACFVDTAHVSVGFESRRTNYETIRPGEGLIHDQSTCWMGPDWVFHRSVTEVYRAFESMRWRGYTLGERDTLGDQTSDMRILVPGRGALISRLVGDSSVTLQLDQRAVDDLVRDYDAQMRKELA